MAAHSTCQPGRPGAERCLPGGLARTLGAPEHGVERIALARPVGVAAAFGEEREHLLAGEPGDRTEVRRRLDREVDVAVEQVGVAVGQQLLDHRDDQRDRLDGADVGLRREHPQRGHVLAEALGLGPRELEPVDAVAGGPFEQRLVDVGDVLDVADLDPGVQQRPLRRGRSSRT